MEMLSIQYLRGIAAMMVVGVHLYPQLERMGYDHYWPHWLASGVDIFFALSGFLMWITTRGKNVTVLEFYRRRVVRIVPLYWVLTSVAVAVMLIAPHLMQSTQFNLMHVIASYLFISTPNPAGHMEPVLTVGWTLNYEMLYYVIFGLTLVLTTAWRFGATALVFVALIAAGWLFPSSNPMWVSYTSNITLEFLLGMGIGWWYARDPRSGSAALGWVLVLGGLAAIVVLSLVAPTLTRPVQQGIPAAAIVIGAIMLERYESLPRLPLLHRLGDASYSIYLSHTIVLSALSQGWRKVGLDALPFGKTAFCVVGVVAVSVVGLAMFRWLEQPLIEVFKKKRVPVTAHAGERVPSH